MYAHTNIYIYIYISQHVDHPNINALCDDANEENEKNSMCVR